MPFKKIGRMNLAWKLTVGSIIWLILISAAHFYLNFDHSDRHTITMGYMPVVTNLAAPLLDEASKQSDGVRYKAKKFSSFAEMAEALRNSEIDAAFMIAPLSIVLRQQGEDINIVYIGNRHESTLVARADLNVKTLQDLAGMTLAVPMRYSGHYLSIMELIKKHGLEDEINVVEMNPPDMASALATGSLDAYYVGEPFAAKTLQSGDSSLVHYVEEVWDGFICNLVVVRKDLIEADRDIVEALVHSAARSGQWASQHPDAAIEVASKHWSQSPELVRYAMSTPDNRIVYNAFKPREDEIQRIADMMVDNGLIENNNIEDLVDDEFAASVSMEGIKADIVSILD